MKTRSRHTLPHPIAPYQHFVVIVLLFIALGACGNRTNEPAPSSSDSNETTGAYATTGADTTADESERSDGAGASVSPPPSSTPSPAGIAPLAKPAEETDSTTRHPTRGEAEMAEREEIPATQPPDEERGRDKDTDSRRTLPQARPAPLKAGERDDNAAFQDYLTYLETYQGIPAIPVDVQERYLITVLGDDQKPLYDATLRIYDRQKQMFEARTYAGGQTIFHPQAHGVSDNTRTFRLVAEYGNTSVETTIDRGAPEPHEIIIPDAQPAEHLRLDILFLLDTTGSMDDELSRIQETIDSIARRIDSFTPRPDLRFGVVAYRDRGDSYETHPYDFTSDVATFRTLLNTLSADGGGDTPESLNKGLHEAIETVQWRTEPTVRLIFLVADAGPHLDYQEAYDYTDSIRLALARGIKIYPIAASNTDAFAEYVFRQLAQQTLAHFLFLTYQPGESSGAPGEQTTLEAGDQPYTVARLDDLIVQVVQQELAAAQGLE